MTQAKLYPAGQLVDHPPLRTLDEAMRERIIALFMEWRAENVRLIAILELQHNRDKVAALNARIDSVLALLKD